MSIIQWKKTYNIGIGLIDDQHKKLIEILNELYEAHKSGTGKDLVNISLEKLVEYTYYHFDAEENMLRANNYPDLQSHIKEHNQFKEKITGFLNESKNGNLLLSIKTIDYLKDWTINHILGTDKEYSDYLLDVELGK